MTEKFGKPNSAQIRWIILLSYLFALVVDAMLFLNPSMSFLPPMTLLMVLYWSSHVVDRTYFVSAFVLGTLIDALYQTTLGAHALLYTLVVFMMLRIRLPFRTFPAWQQAFIIGFYLLIYQGLNTLFFTPVLEDELVVYYWSMPAASIILWPILHTFLSRISHGSH